MAQLLFVHGVATRSSDAYTIESNNRDKLFREVLLGDATAGIHAPIWGDEVPEIPPTLFDRHDAVESYAIGGGSFGGMGGGLSGGGLSAGDEGNPVADLAQRNGTVALDAVLTTLVEQRDAAGEALTPADIAAFRQAVALSEAGGALPPTASDSELADKLSGGGDESFGIDVGGALRSAVGAVADRLRNAASGVVFDAARGVVGPLVGKFFGDVFAYMNEGPIRDAIRAKVREGIQDAVKAAREKNQPLICIGHSLGGVILYDMLSSPVSAGLPAGLKVDAFLTVGSQPGLFQALNLFELKHVAGARNPGPDCAAAWMNVFDPIDPFGYYAEPMFSKVKDYSFDSVTGLISAHTTYFKRPQFHAKSRAHLKELGVI